MLLVPPVMPAHRNPLPSRAPSSPSAGATLSGIAAADTSTAQEHPRHMVKVWLTKHRRRTFRVIQLPRCEHMEAVIAYHRRGETKEEAKERLDGVAVSTGAFHHSISMALADFYQVDGCILSSATTGRWFFAIMGDGSVDLSGDYGTLKHAPGVNALALGQRLAPVLQRDGFSTAFMNRVTDRMALGMSPDYIFIVQGRSDIWRLADFMQKELPVHTAVNCDGGHVVRGKAPVHIVFRWRQPGQTAPPPPPQHDSLRASSASTTAGG
jgi:hypothetical protein